LIIIQSAARFWHIFGQELKNQELISLRLSNLSKARLHITIAWVLFWFDVFRINEGDEAAGWYGPPIKAGYGHSASD